MAKIDINFNNNKYTIDESALSAASSALKSHLSSVMSGTGATINFDGVTYSVDSTKLTNATNAFVSHLGTISGSGHKVKVGGVEYSVGSDKVSGAVSELDAVLGGLNSGGGAGKVIEFDGNLEGREVFTLYRKEYVKVTDKFFPPESFDGATIVASQGNQLFDVTLSNFTVMPLPAEDNTIAGVVVLDGDDLIILSINNATSQMIEEGFPSETGTYFHTCYDEVAGGYWIKSVSCVTESTPSTPVSPETLEGDGQEFHKFAPTALTFRSTAPLNELQEVQINGVTVDPSNYTLEEGSTIVTLPIEYLKTLDVDNYEITVVSDNKTAKGGFTVVQPELNEHGFYYNQPYTAYVDMFGENESFFIRNDGILDVVGTPSGDVSKCTYTVDGNTITVVSPVIGILTATIAPDGKSIYCNELAISFALGNDAIIADDDYIYIYKEDLDGYEVSAVNKTKDSYGVIKDGINGINTVKLANKAFYDFIIMDGNPNLIVAPDIPNSVTSIGEWSFAYCRSLTFIVIPDSINSIGDNAFLNSTNLNSITFEGTTAQWNAISKGVDWSGNVPATYVQCSDGQVPLN